MFERFQILSKNYKCFSVQQLVSLLHNHNIICDDKLHFNRILNLFIIGTNCKKKFHYLGIYFCYKNKFHVFVA